MDLTAEHYDLDLGDGHWLTFTCWAPDRKLNPQYDNIPDVGKWGAIIRHTKPDGTSCMGCITFDGPVQQRLAASNPRWIVESWAPLSISPSLLCDCGDHGFIRNDKWVKA